MGIDFFSGIFSILLLLFSGASTDLASLMTPEQYWQAKGRTPTTTELIAEVAPEKPSGDVKKLVGDLSSAEFKTRETARKNLEQMGPDVVPLLKDASESKDAEVADTAKGIIQTLTLHAKARDVERLMAIRTLGEKTEQSALPVLKEAVKSTEPFVSDYALRAVGEIEGHPVTLADHKADFEKDLWLLPKETGTIVQATPSSWLGKIDIDTVLDKMGNQVVPGMAVPGKAQLEKKLSEGLVTVLERVGDVRFDGATVGISADVSDDAGWVVGIVRGQYDREAVVGAIKSLAGDDAPFSREGDADVFTPEESAKIAFLDGRVLIITSDKKETTEALFTQTMKAIGGSGQGGLKENTAMAGLIAKADRAGPVWGVSQVPAFIKKELADVAPYDTVTLRSAEKGNSLAFTITGTGSDAEQVKASSDKMQGELADAVKQAKQMAGQMPPQVMDEEKGEIAFAESLAFKTEGTTTVLTGEFGAAMVDSLKSAMVMYAELMGADIPDVQVQAVPAVPEVPASQP